MSEVKPIATVCLRGEGYAHGHMLDVQLQIMPDTDLPIGTRLYDERVVAELQISRAEHAGRARLAETRLIEAEQRASIAEAALAGLREKLDEQVQITARIANENASNRLRAERAEARVAELERQFRENARKAREQAEFGAAGAWDDAATAIEQQLAALQGGEA